ncbi:probable iron-containing alcohol dehydrogenase [marine gamma proteobacterium HTCC2207]|jgi:alcohol dehydrogenase class IV|uniref:Probable iron-containing alcohol dehydrogenase n=1 Tax=gamma proteobacterium HTCC2207 TaxID=314287 RepID=Q1YQ96_9GAMM|nr:probable iron-containing alcohol dehydrogenase [marine gamma proteobacterium HTCC2207] [gamma proteobacterium HTCC2207]MDB4428050.1 iron-containing alcohol dehydrogenase [Porticoccaceae bacterium]MDC0589067.1 iron-containing alcohol dehydrogenase [Porticoccaceae bacterium]MDG1080620.1 iron-containing alcohol dehydrogenase [Porticoccaceae bacterium]
MDSFFYSAVSDVLVGAGTSTQLGDLAASMGIQRALIVTDPGIIKFGLLDGAVANLKANNIELSIYSDVIADPPESVVMDAVSSAQAFGCDGVIGFGGGSSMDVAKLLAVLIKGEQQLSEIYGVDQISGGRLPLIQVPTTAGTGSEATMVSIITTGETTKAGVVSRTLLADKVILDAKLTLGLPPTVTAATGIDAMVHAIEAYTSVRLKNPLSDMLAREALRLMASNISTAVKQGDNLQAREAMLLGAMLAGQAFANAPVAAVHALAYPLGGNYHIPHGLSNSLVLPHVLRFNAPAAAELYAELAPIILPGTTLPSDPLKVSELLAEHFLQLAADLGLQTKLSEMNIAESDLPKLAEEAMLQQRLLINNPRELSLDDALSIYQQAF